MEVNALSAVFGGIGTLIGIVITVITFWRNQNKDTRDDAAQQASQQAVVNTKLDTINHGIESLRVDFKVEQQARAALSERVARVEESVDSAHKRIDQFHGRADQ